MKQPSSTGNPRRSWFWIPSLYFAEGLPAALVTTVSLITFSNLQIPAEKTLFWTGLFSLPWMLRPLWVPVIDRLGTPRSWAVVLEFVMGGLFAGAGAAIACGAWFPAVCCCFFAVAIASATHDAAADGFYIIALNASEQAAFSGIRSAVYKFGTVAGLGFLTMAAGALLEIVSAGTAWGCVYGFAGVLLILTGLWHLFFMPPSPEKSPQNVPKPREARSLFKQTAAFFAPYLETVRTPGFGKLLAFLLLFRLGESQLRAAVPFLLARRSAGGMELTVSQQGMLYGTCGSIALIAGGILSGLAVSRHGMKRWLWPMVLAINVPDLVYVYLSWIRPESLWLIGGCVLIEQFGYGFGFTLLTLSMVSASRGGGGNETTRFALFTALSLFGVMIPGSFAGFLLKLPAVWWGLDDLACYRIFFIWVMLCTIPSFMTAALISPQICRDFPPPPSGSRE